MSNKDYCIENDMALQKELAAVEEVTVERLLQKIKELEDRNDLLERSLKAENDRLERDEIIKVEIKKLQTQMADLEYNASQIITTRDKCIAELGEKIAELESLNSGLKAAVESLEADNMSLLDDYYQSHETTQEKSHE